MVQLGLAVAIFGAVLGFNPLSSEPFISTKVLLVLAGSLMALCGMCVKPRNGIGGQGFIIAIWACLLAGSAFLSCDPFVSLLGMGDSSAGCALSFAALALAVTACQMSNWKEQRIENMCMLACALSAAYAVAQRLGVDPLFAHYTREFYGRSFSTMGGPVLLAPVLAAALPVAFARQRYFVFAILLAGLYCTGTRAALGGGLAGVALVACLSGLLPLRWAAAGGFAGVAVAAISRAGALGSDLGRLSLWKISWHAFTQQPVWGWGANTFGLVMRQYIGQDYVRLNGDTHIHWHAHNIILQTLFSHGVIGLLALAVTAAFIFSLWTLRRDTNAGAFGGLLAVLLCAQTNPIPMAAWLVAFLPLCPLLHRLRMPCLPRWTTYGATAAALALLLVQVRVVRAEYETHMGRVAWAQERGVDAANHYNKAATLNPWLSSTIINQLDSSRNLVPWMPRAQQEQVASDGLLIAQRMVQRHPMDSRAHETLSAQLSLSAALARGDARERLLDQAGYAIADARDLAPTYPPLQYRQKLIAAHGGL